MLIGKILFTVGMCFIDTKGSGYAKVINLTSKAVTIDLYGGVTVTSPLGTKKGGYVRLKRFKLPLTDLKKAVLDAPERTEVIDCPE